MQITRQEAEEVSRALNHARTMIVARMRAIQRKRSWLPSVKAMSLATEGTALDTLVKFHEAFKSEHRIGGY